MTNIFDLPTAWRDSLMPASFNGARFHCEANSRESGRRIVQHQFPKKDLPYAEDMGRAARQFAVRGYCIVFPYDSEHTLYSRDYRRSRDELIRQTSSANNSRCIGLPRLTRIAIFEASGTSSRRISIRFATKISPNVVAPCHVATWSR